MSKNAMSSGQARAIKLSGDSLRKYFETQCNDCQGRIKQEYLKGLSNQNSEGSYVLKSGNNWQFHLGSFAPYTENWGVQFFNGGKNVKYNSLESRILNDLRSEQFLRLFMLKGNFFVIYDAPNWLIFDGDDIINLFQDTEKLQFRILDSGRIKGDFRVNEKKQTLLTLEYRAEEHKKQFVFGAHGGNAGERLKKILKDSLFFNFIPVDYELWQ